MTARTPATLKTNMPAGTPGGTTIADMHDFIDTVSARTTFSVVEFGAVGDDDQAKAAANTAAFIAATAAAAAQPNGTGAVYIPSGQYHVNPNQWSIPSRTKVFGDGYGTKIRKNGDGWLLDISGTGWFNDPRRLNDPSKDQTRNSYCIIRDVQLDGKNNDDCLVRLVYASEVLFDKVRFSFNAGPGIDAVEWWDSRVNNCFFDWCGDVNNPAALIRNNSSTNIDTHGYSEDSSNAIYFYGCRFESFKNGAIMLDKGPLNDNSPVSQVYITNCKCETFYLNGPVIQFAAAAAATNVHIDTLFIAVTRFNPGYTTATNLIDWSVSSCCSIRNVFATIQSVDEFDVPIYLCRSVVRCNVSVGNNTIENVWIQGAQPTLAIVDFQTGTQNNLKMMGWVGGITSSLGAPAIAKNGGGNKVLTGTTYQAVLADDGLTYTNATNANITVTLPNRVPAGWRVKAVALTATSTITFSTTSTSFTVNSDKTPVGTTFTTSYTINAKTVGHNKTAAAAFATVELWCYAQTSTLNAATLLLTGDTA